MKSTFVTLFDNNLPRLPDANGRDQITSACRVGLVPIDGVSTNVVLIEAPADVVAEIKVDPAYLWVEDLPDE